MIDHELHEILKRLSSEVLWHDTRFADIQYYYAEEGTYILRCKHGKANEHLCIVKARSVDEAISHTIWLNPPFVLHQRSQPPSLQARHDSSTYAYIGDNGRTAFPPLKKNHLRFAWKQMTYNEGDEE